MRRVLALLLTLVAFGSSADEYYQQSTGGKFNLTWAEMTAQALAHIDAQDTATYDGVIWLKKEKAAFCDSI